MKSIFIMVLSLFTFQVLAIDSLCVTKQKNAASFQLAQKIGVSVQGAEIINFENGIWTEAVGNNVGSDNVTVRIGNRLDRAMTIKKYKVSVKQLGATDDCKILKVVEVQD